MQSESILLAVRFFLSPIIRFCLKHSIKIQELQLLLKKVYLSEAEAEIISRKDELTLSKLSVMTGIPRKFVNKLREAQLNEKSNSIITHFISAWLAHKKHGSGFSKVPNPLSCEGNDSDFAKIVRKISVDLNPYTILFELERVGMIRKDKDKIFLQNKIYPLKKISEIFSHGSQDLDTLIKCLESNSYEEEKKYLHLTTQLDNIPDEYLDKIRNWFLKKGAQIHEEALEYLSQFDRDFSKTSNHHIGRNKVRFVTYQFTEGYNEK